MMPMTLTLLMIPRQGTKPEVIAMQVYSNRNNMLNQRVKTKETRSMLKSLESDISIIEKEESLKKPTRIELNKLFDTHKRKLFLEHAVFR